jgi:hypothetical protein
MNIKYKEIQSLARRIWRTNLTQLS